MTGRVKTTGSVKEPSSVFFRTETPKKYFQWIRLLWKCSPTLSTLDSITPTQVTQILFMWVGKRLLISFFFLTKQKKNTQIFCFRCSNLPLFFVLGDGIKISNLTDKINFEMKINSIGSNDKHLCLYWDASQMTWVQMSEAFVNRTTSTGICSSSHLSMFVVASKTSESIFSCSFSRGSSNTLTSSVKRSY